MAGRPLSFLPAPVSAQANRLPKTSSTPVELHTHSRDAVAELAEALGRILRDQLAPPPLLDLAGAAARLNVSERTVESLVALGEIPVVRIGTGRGVRRFDPAAIEAFIRRQARSL